jgi:citrate synthase
MTDTLRTDIGTHDLDHIWVRDLDLTADVMGRMNFGEVMFLLVAARAPDPSEARLVNTVLVSLMEHGLTPSAVVARVTYGLVPDAIQGAIAAGLLGVGGVVLGSMEGCGELLTQIQAAGLDGTPAADAAQKVVAEYRASGRRIPGIGHAIHTNGDPRAARLLQIADECGKSGSYVEALHALASAADAATGRHLPINVTGAVSAVLLELGIPWRLHRGFALVSRTAGLVAHIGEEMEQPLTPAFRAMTRGEP